jgi:alkylhydroperoxidase/carboxymuconolactone decarboxylase family protein YurZ
MKGHKMDFPTPPFIAPLAPNPEFHDQVADMYRQTYCEPDALDVKTKLLIGLALDVAANVPGGAKSISGLARQAGATEAEIVSVLRIVYAGTGFQKLITGLSAVDRSASARPAAQ